MGIEKLLIGLTEIFKTQKHTTVLQRANNTKLDKLIEVQKLILDVQKCQKEMLTVDELVMYTGLSKNWVYKLTSNKILPHYKPTGKLMYFKRSEIDDWIMKSPILPSKTLEQFEFELIKKKMF